MAKVSDGKLAFRADFHHRASHNAKFLLYLIAYKYPHKKG